MHDNDKDRIGSVYAQFRKISIPRVFVVFPGKVCPSPLGLGLGFPALTDSMYVY